MHQRLPSINRKSLAAEGSLPMFIDAGEYNNNTRSHLWSQRDGTQSGQSGIWLYSGGGLVAALKWLFGTTRWSRHFCLPSIFCKFWFIIVFLYCTAIDPVP